MVTIKLTVRALPVVPIISIVIRVTISVIRSLVLSYSGPDCISRYMSAKPSNISAEV